MLRRCTKHAPIGEKVPCFLWETGHWKVNLHLMTHASGKAIFIGSFIIRFLTLTLSSVEIKL
jgi:hypothetical protein